MERPNWEPPGPGDGVCVQEGGDGARATTLWCVGDLEYLTQRHAGKGRTQAGHGGELPEGMW